MAEDYALTSISEIKRLQKELEELKKNPLGSTSSGRNLMENLEGVSDSLVNMMDLFKEASEQMKLEEREEQILAKKIGPILEKLEAIEDQNKKIAQGIVAVADMVEEISAKIEQQPASSPKQSQSLDIPEFRQRPSAPSMPPPLSSMTDRPSAMIGPTAPPFPSMSGGQEDFGDLPPMEDLDFPGQPIKPAPSMAPSRSGMPPPPSMGGPAPQRLERQDSRRRKGFLDMFASK